MLSDRLGANMSWPEQSAPAWYAPLAALQPYRSTDAVAMTLYEEALTAHTPQDIPPATLNFQLGRLQWQAGLREQGMRSLQSALQFYLRQKSETHGSGYVADHIAGVHIQFSRVYEAEGRFAESLRERQQALEVLEDESSQNPQSIYLLERLSSSRISAARLLARLGRHAEALRDGGLGLRQVEENADRARAAALNLDSAAQRLLTVEPVELRDAARAREYARRAVAQTASQMPPYLVTLAFAELASGHDEDGRRAAILAVQGYRKVSEILAPLFDGANPQAARFYGEWRRQLDQLSSLVTRMPGSQVAAPH
jgi:tetratricopeptide (TPR) repeat protein